MKRLGWPAVLFSAVLAGCSTPETEAPPAPEPATPASRPETDVTTAALLRETSELYRRGQYDEGLARLEEELSRDPDRPRLHHNLGIFRAALRDYEGAIQAFEEELARHGSYLDSHRGLGTAYSRLGRSEESIPPFESCLAIAPDDAVCAFGLGSNLSVLGLFDQALPHLERAAELRLDAEAWSELGIAYRRVNDLERSIGAFSKALATDPAHLKTLLGYGQALSALGRAEDGQILLERHRHLAELEDKLDAFERGRRQNQAPLQAYLDVARIHLEREDQAAAAATYEEAMELTPDNPIPALELARLYLDQDRLGDAGRCVEHALAIDPQNSGPHFYHGLLLLKRGDLTAAEQAFATSLKLGGWPPAAFLDAGNAYHAAGDFNRAANAFFEAVRLEPGSPLTNHRLALAALEHGDRPAAEKGARRVLDLDPGHGAAWVLLGVLRFEAGDSSGAEAAFAKAIEAEKITLLRHGGVEQVLEDFPGGREARQAFRRLLNEAG